MGEKGSMVIIQSPDKKVDDIQLLDTLGFKDHVQMGEEYWVNAIYPRDKSVCIGSYNDCIIITEDFQLSEKLDLSKDPEALMDFERELSALFPESEVLTIACHSTTNFHMYSLVKNQEKIRFKRIDGDGNKMEWGSRLAEEEKVYTKAVEREGSPIWIMDEEEYVEDQMMEEFFHTVASRHIGEHSSFDGDEPAGNVLFKKYIYQKNRSLVPKDTQIWESELGTHWLEDECMIFLPKLIQRTEENVKSTGAVMRSICQGKRIPMIQCYTKQSDYPEELASLMSDIVMELFTSVAVIKNSGWSCFIKNLFMRNHKELPIKYFKSKAEAIAWAKSLHSTK